MVAIGLIAAVVLAGLAVGWVGGSLVRRRLMPQGDNMAAMRVEVGDDAFLLARGMSHEEIGEQLDSLLLEEQKRQNQASLKQAREGWERQARTEKLMQVWAELERTRAKFERTQAELVRTQAELVRTQAELEQTRAELERTQAELVRAQAGPGSGISATKAAGQRGGKR